MLHFIRLPLDQIPGKPMSPHHNWDRAIVIEAFNFGAALIKLRELMPELPEEWHRALRNEPDLSTSIEGAVVVEATVPGGQDEAELDVKVIERTG